MATQTGKGEVSFNVNSKILKKILVIQSYSAAV
jgi:hypothetical protein